LPPDRNYEATNGHMKFNLFLFFSQKIASLMFCNVRNLYKFGKIRIRFLYTFW